MASSINNQKKNPTLSQVKKTNQENKFSDLKMNLEKTGGPSELFQKNRTELNSDEKFVVKGTAVGAFVGTVAGAAIGGVAGAFVGAAIGSVVGFAISATIVSVDHFGPANSLDPYSFSVMNNNIISAGWEAIQTTFKGGCDLLNSVGNTIQSQILNSIGPSPENTNLSLALENFQTSLTQLSNQFRNFTIPLREVNFTGIQESFNSTMINLNQLGSNFNEIMRNFPVIDLSGIGESISTALSHIDLSQVGTTLQNMGTAASNLGEIIGSGLDSALNGISTLGADGLAALAPLGNSIGAVVSSAGEVVGGGISIICSALSELPES